MWDVCVKSVQHPHLVDKWDFVAFAVGGAEPLWGLDVWRRRFKAAAAQGKKRSRVEPKLWRPECLKRRRKEVSKKRQRVAAEATEPIATAEPAGLQEAVEVLSREVAEARRERALYAGSRVGSVKVLRVLSLFDGCGAASLALEALQLEFGAAVEITVVEIDDVCRSFTQWRFPKQRQGWSCDVIDWASDGFRPAAYQHKYWFDLVIGGFPCQDLSSAHKQGAGLEGSRSGLFFKTWKVIQKLRQVNSRLDFVLECVDFRKKHPADFQEVTDTTGVQPVILCASCIAACYRKRAFWASFKISDLEEKRVEPWQVLEAERWTDMEKLPTVMASGTRSWNTAQVVFDQRFGGLELGPLLTVEMERAMGMPDGYTAMDGIGERKRHHMIGNSFHVGVIEHVIRWWLLKMWQFDSTLGYPGEGPSDNKKQKRRRVYDGLDDGCDKRRMLNVPVVQRAEQQQVRVERPEARTKKPVQGRRQAAWKGVLPAGKQTIKGASLFDVWESGGWGSSERLVLGKFATAQKIAVPIGSGFSDFVKKLQHDLILGARSDNTRKAYVAWVEVFAAWLDRYDLSVVVSRQQQGCTAIWENWVEVLSAAVACLAMCYSAGTVTIFVSAVSAYMQDHGFKSPFAHTFFARLYKGTVRFLGTGKKKKPPVEAKHVAAIVKRGRVIHARGFTVLQYIQAIAVFVMGWQLFNRAQDFEEFQICDFTFLDKGLRVLVRRAKNDVKGMTRSPVLEFAADAIGCPVKLLRKYFLAAGIRIMDGCTKVDGSPHRCLCCPPAFPSVHKHSGKQAGRGDERMGMPTARVTEIVRGLYVGLAIAGEISMEEAVEFSSKSLRCGGVSQAAAEAIRDGVTQAHGGWLIRQSLVHYDLARPDEAFDVSHALNEATSKCMRELLAG